MSDTYRHDPAFLKAVETLIQTIQFDVNGTAGKGGNGGLTSDKAIRQSGELNIMIDRIKKQEAATSADQSQRQLFEKSVVTRLMDSGFLEIEIRTECLTRCGDGYQDEVINAGWHYWNAAVTAERNRFFRICEDEYEKRLASDYPMARKHDFVVVARSIQFQICTPLMEDRSFRDVAAPDGWKLVPKELMPAQLETAAFNLSAEYGPEFVAANQAFARDVYAELVAAVPAAKQEG